MTIPPHGGDLTVPAPSTVSLLLIDNFDSFTYNLVQAFQILGAHVQVVRNNRLTPKECLALKPDFLVISPGPGNPQQAGISIPLIKSAVGILPILGVCLGHQCLIESFGGKIIRAKEPVHGKTSQIFHTNTGVFNHLSQGFHATRYHSLIADKQHLPDTLEITAETSSGEIMGVRHRTFPLEGVQFHPESIMTEEGMHLLKNFLSQKIS